MANCYLCRYETIDYNGPTRIPAGVWQQLRPNNVPWGSVDLSSDGRGAGKDYAFLATTGSLVEQVSPRIWSVGTEATPINQAMRNRIGGELGLTLTATTLGGLVEEVLVSQGLVVQPEPDGVIRIYLGPTLLVEHPA